MTAANAYRGRGILMRGGTANMAYRYRVAWLSVVMLVAVAAAAQAGRWFALADVITTAAPLTAAAAAMAGVVLLMRPRRSRTGMMIVAAAALALSGERLWPELTRIIPAADAGAADTLRILSFNVWRANPDPGRAIAAIRAARADVVLLQEAGGTVWPHLAALTALYPYRSRCERPPCHLMILARWPLASRYRFRDAAGNQTGPRLIQARVTPPGRSGFTVATIHLDRPPSAIPGGPAGFGAAVLGAGDPRVILGGDFNRTPWSFALQRIDSAMAPVARADRAIATYPAGAPVLPIDHLYAGPAWLVRSVERLPQAGSDHRGLVAVLQPVGR